MLMGAEKDIDFALKQIERTGTLIPMLVVEVEDKSMVMALGWTDDDEKRAMISMASLLAGWLGAKEIRLIVDSWVSTPQGKAKYGMPRDDPDHTEAIVVTTATVTEVRTDMCQYERQGDKVVKVESESFPSKDGYAGGWIADTMKFGLISGADESHPPEMFHEIARALGVDIGEQSG